MFKINRQVEYALLAVKHLHGQERDCLITPKTLSEEYECPPEMSAKTLQAMARSGILDSVKGAHGGYRLARPLSTISFYKLSEGILGSLALANCLGENIKLCEQAKHCTIISPIYKLNERILRLFKTITVLELVEFKSIRQEKQIKANMLALLE